MTQPPSPSPQSRSGRLLRLLAFALILGVGLWLRGRDLAATPTNGDESESAINALTIAQRGVPSGEYLGLPIYENCLVEPWPDHPEYEFRDSSYAANGMTIYHGWLPLYAIWASQRLMNVAPDDVAAAGEPLRVRHSPQEIRRRVVAARAPSVVFGGAFLVFLFLAGKEMFGVDAAFAAMLVGAIGRPLVYLGREARYYSATLALTTGCCWAAWRIYRRGRWGDFIVAAVLLSLLFHTHVLAFFVAGAMFALATAAMLWRVRQRGVVGRGEAGVSAYTVRIVCAAAIVVAAALPWLVWTGFFSQASHIPRAVTFLSFPADLIWYPVVRVPYLLLPILCAAWLVVVTLLHRWLPPRVTRPLANHRLAIAYLLAWIGVGILSFTLLIPAASYFYKRLTLAVMGPGIVWGAILFAAAARAIRRDRAILLAPAAFALTITVSNMGHLWFLERKDLTEAYEMIEHLRARPLAPGTKLYCTPNDQLTLTYLAGLPVQSVAPIRKHFLNTYPGPVVVIDTAVPYEPLWWRSVKHITEAGGQPLNSQESQDLTVKLRPRLVAERVVAAGIPCEPPLVPLSQLEQEIVDYQVKVTVDDLRDFQRKGANNPLVRGYAMRDWADWWPLFFYRFVDPRSRMGERLNYAGRVRMGSAEVLPSSWVIYRCPVPVPEPAGDSEASGNARGNAP